MVVNHSKQKTDVHSTRNWNEGVAVRFSSVIFLLSAFFILAGANAFSQTPKKPEVALFEGRRFDLGLYEAGSTREVHFNKPGISYIFCNIHPEMSAVVVALETPYYGISDQHGQVVIANVPAGRYTLRVWSESGLPETLKTMTREVTVSENSSTLGVLRLSARNLPAGHKNLYGRDYDPPNPDSPAYDRH